jgi:hypothetical protein
MSELVGDSAAVAVAALAVQAAMAEAKVVAAGGPSSAWSISASIADAAHAASGTDEFRAAIFDLAAKQAARAFELERIKAGAAKPDWAAFDTAKSTHKTALALGVFSSQFSKGETTRAIKTAKDAVAANAAILAKQAGLV